jgi:hypothetical protein
MVGGKPAQTNKAMLIGLTEAGWTEHEDFNACMKIRGDGNIATHIFGVETALGGSYSAGDLLEIEYAPHIGGGTFFFYQNGVEVVAFRETGVGNNLALTPLMAASSGSSIINECKVNERL